MNELRPFIEAEGCLRQQVIAVTPNRCRLRNGDAHPRARRRHEERVSFPSRPLDRIRPPSQRLGGFFRVDAANRAGGRTRARDGRKLQPSICDRWAHRDPAAAAFLLGACPRIHGRAMCRKSQVKSYRLEPASRRFDRFHLRRCDIRRCILNRRFCCSGGRFGLRDIDRLRVVRAKGFCRPAVVFLVTGNVTNRADKQARKRPC